MRCQAAAHGSLRDASQPGVSSSVRSARPAGRRAKQCTGLHLSRWSKLQPRPARLPAPRAADWDPWDPDPDPQDEPDFIASDLVHGLFRAGLTGSATALAATLLGVDLTAPSLWEQRPPDLQLALALFSPLLVLEAALFAPAWPFPAALKAGGAGTRLSRKRGVDLEALKAASGRADSLRLLLALYPAVLRPADGIAHRHSRPKDVPELLPAPDAAALMAAEQLMQEVLQRGLVFTLAAGWLRDRVFEFGLESWALPLPLGQSLPGQELALWLAAAATTAAFHRTAFAAADSAKLSVASALLRRTPAGRLWAFSVGPQAVRARGSASGSARGSACARGSASGSVCSRGGGAEDEAARLEEEDELKVLDYPDVLEWRVAAAEDDCGACEAAQLAHQLTLGRELARLALANAAFVATRGSLAATLGVAVLAAGLQLLYAERRRERGDDSPAL